MACINLDAIKKLEETTNVDFYIDGAKILLNLLENVIREPDNPKYRTIRLENKVIKEKLLVLNGAREVLTQIGFHQHDDKLSLSNDVLIATLKKYRDFLTERLKIAQGNGSQLPAESINDNQPSTSVAVRETIAIIKSSGAIKKRRNDIKPLKCYRDRINFPKIIPFDISFLKQMEHFSDEVQQYEDDRLQWYGLRLIPVERLTENALQNMRAIQKRQRTEKTMTDPCFRDWLLVELTKWFKEEFFTWVNTLPCKMCGSMAQKAMKRKIQNDIRVEMFDCCNETTEFSRFNDISQLLRTRKGRCGEFANCFTFLCRCLDYDARYVVASFDHVWTEVYSVAQKKWIHVDPSDNIIDAPLIYEHGWKRDIDFIIAYSKDDIQDVTWRYVTNFEKVRKERANTDFLEDLLLQTILLLRKKRQANCTAARIKYLKKRNLCELIELLLPRQPTENEKKGRSSGSLDWRLSRGEMQRCVNTFNVFTPLQQEIKTKQFNLRYSCSKNSYERFLEDESSDGTEAILETKSNWDSCVHTSENIFRKEEPDWKMVYLARIEDTDNAKITWAFNFAENNLKIKDIHLTLATAIYENGLINVRYLHKGTVLSKLEDVKGLCEFSIEVSMSGGKGDCAWQHTQLFRQSMTARNQYPFILKIKFL